MSRKVLSLAAALLFATSCVFSNGLSLNSIGTRSLGMGGSFIGLANDYTAIYWNPAGISQLKGNYIGLFSTDVIPTGSYKIDALGIDAKMKTNHYISPNLMGYVSFEPAKDFTFALGVYVPAGLGSEWDGKDLAKLTGGTALDWMSKIAVVDISPAVSYKVNENLSVGAALNIFYGMFDMKKPAGMLGPDQKVHYFQFTETSDGLGYGVTLGAHYKVNEMISLGASFRTKTAVSMSGTATNPAFAALGSTESKFSRDVAWPMWIGGGVAVRPMENWVITADAQYSQWSKSEDQFTATYDNANWQAAMVSAKANVFDLKWKDATQIRFGTEYQINNSFAVRGGYYIDPAPAPDETYNILFPSISYNAVSVGASYKVSNLTFDLGLEYLAGKERTIGPFVNSMNITGLSFGVGYGF
ncbi:MAG TPA: outer membrane protein transport protein [Ignavibacteriales bacterium]|nr:outer membrane protein transport protein [Ignavibacteriales bacterium]